MTSGDPGVLVIRLSDEPRVHRRFWSAIRRARSTAARILLGAPEPPPDPFVVEVPPGHRYNVTSSGQFLIGHAGGVVTSLAIWSGACTTSR